MRREDGKKHRQPRRSGQEGETASGPTITISNRQKALRISAARLRRLVAFAAAAERRPVDSIDVAIVGAEEIESLNQRYLDQACATDVLSFDLSDDDSAGISAQIVVCGDVALQQGPRHGLTAEDELMLYVLHGLLHLTGYDDATAAEAAAMKARQEHILAEFTRGTDTLIQPS